MVKKLSDVWYESGISRERQKHGKKLKLWKLRESAEKCREQVKKISAECQEQGECVNEGRDKMQRVLVDVTEKTVGRTSKGNVVTVTGSARSNGGEEGSF